MRSWKRMRLDLPLEIEWSFDDHKYVATCLAFPGLSGLSQSQAEAFEELHTAIQAWLDRMGD